MAMAATATQLFRSTDTNSPVISGTVGTLLAAIQAWAVDGYTAASVTSITESGTTYTVTLGAANNTLNTGNYLKIAGCTGAFTALNDRWQITVSSSTVVTFTGPGGLGSPATGTITYAKAGLGWSNAFASAGNIGVFRPQSVTGRTNQFYYRCNDNAPNATPGAREACGRAYVTMSDLSTGTEAYPTTAQQADPGRVWRKSTTADSTARAWYAWGDGATLYWVINSDGTANTGRMLCGFGGYLTDVAGDGYNSFLSGAASSNSAAPSAGNGTLSTPVSPVATTIWNVAHTPRSYTQLGTSVPICGLQMWGSGASGNPISYISNNFMPYPHPVDSGLYVGPILVVEAGMAIRGRFPGLYGHMHVTAPCNEGDQVTTVVGLTGVTLRAVTVASVSQTGMVFADEFGPW